MKVRFYDGVPPATAFRDGTGTLLIIDRTTSIVYYVDPKTFVVTATAGGGGGGGVTAVSVTTANGVSGSVANPATMPAITLTLGAITPTSVAASGTVSGSNLSGTNTGDQTITLTGDVTGSGTGSFATTIAPGKLLTRSDVQAILQLPSFL